MRNRIKAAWMVLRGEWTASAPPLPFVYSTDTAYESSGNAVGSFTITSITPR